MRVVGSQEEIAEACNCITASAVRLAAFRFRSPPVGQVFVTTRFVCAADAVLSQQSTVLGTAVWLLLRQRMLLALQGIYWEALSVVVVNRPVCLDQALI